MSDPTITRDQLKAATKRRTTGDAAGTKATKVSDALAPDRAVELGGRTFDLAPLNFNDLIEIEEAYGSTEAFFDQVSQEKASALRYFAWIMLKKSEPDLTIEEAGALMPARQSDLVGLMSRIVAATGLQSDAEGNAESLPTGS